MFRLLGCTCRTPYAYTALPSRALLSLTGQDSAKFLQGLITNDIKRLAASDRSLYAAILKADGRMLHDIFLYPHPNEDPALVAYLLDHDSTVTSTLRPYLQRHILRSKVKLSKTADSTKSIFAAWPSPLEIVDGHSKKIEGREEAEEWLSSRAGRDPRHAGLGWRWQASNTEGLPPSHLFTAVPPSTHELLRLSLSIPEGPLDWPSLPLEGNLDYLNGVDFKKGCYVGQELTARTHHRGVVRKRGVGLRLFREGEPIPTSLLPSPFSEMEMAPTVPRLPFLPVVNSNLTLLTPLKPSKARARPSGKLGSSFAVSTADIATPSMILGLGSVRLEHIGTGESEGIFVVTPPVPEEGAEMPAVVEGAEKDTDERRWLAKAFVPDWVAERIAFEIVKE